MSKPGKAIDDQDSPVAAALAEGSYRGRDKPDRGRNDTEQKKHDRATERFNKRESIIKECSCDGNHPEDARAAGENDAW